VRSVRQMSLKVMQLPADFFLLLAQNNSHLTRQINEFMTWGKNFPKTASHFLGNAHVACRISFPKTASHFLGNALIAHIVEIWAINAQACIQAACKK